MPATERPKVLLFVPYAASARICGTKYVNDLAHTTTGWLIADLIGQTIDSGTAGAETNFNVTATLVAGQTYTCRIQYTNSAGTSEWSIVTASTVLSSGFDITPITTPALPGATSAPFTLAISPSYRVVVENKRGLLTHMTQAGHTVRRLTSEQGYQTVRLQWFGLTATQRDTVLAVLQDSLGSYDTSEVRGFDFSTVEPGPGRAVVAVTYLPLRGSIIRREMMPGVFEILVDATEVNP